MRRILYACLAMTLLAGSIYAFELAVPRSVTPPPAYPIASIGDVFRHL